MSLRQLCYSLPPLLTAVLLIFLAVAALRRGRRSSTNRLFVCLCLLASLLYLDILFSLNAPSAVWAVFSNRVGHLFHPFLVPVFIHFFHSFLKIDRRRWLVGAAYGVAAGLAAFACGDLMISASHRFDFGYFGQAGPLYPVMALGAASATGYNLVIIHQAIRREDRPIERNKLKYVFVGFGILGVLSSLNTLPMFGHAIYPPGAFGFIPMAVLTAGIFKYDLLDMGLLIRKGLLYATLTTFLAGTYVIMMIAAQHLPGGRGLIDSFFFSVVFFALVVLLYGYLKRKFQVLFEKTLAGGRYDYRQTIKMASRSIASVLDYQGITHLMQETLIDGMRVKSCILFVADPRSEGYIPMAGAGRSADGDNLSSLVADACLTRHLRLSEGPVRKQQLLGQDAHGGNAALLNAMVHLCADVVLPMHFKQRLNGFLVLGAKQSGALYTHEDLDLLETLCHQSALAIENARAYHALAELNRHLEVKVAQRTQALQNALVEKERTQEQLIRSESLAALGQLVAGVAHELNNPLASVTSLLQSTLEDLQLWDAQKSPGDDLMDDLRFADKELARAKAIVASLLGLARQTQTYEERVDLNAVVRDALRILSNQCKQADVTIVENLDSDLPVIMGNFANLGQVVLNIVQNAIQAVAGRDGRIELSTTARLDPDRRVVFACRDNGPGIDPEVRQDVFKPFFTTKPVGQGTGLGLYIAHEIIRKHGGTIALENPPSGGTRLTVTVPTSGALIASPAI